MGPAAAWSHRNTTEPRGWAHLGTGASLWNPPLPTKSVPGHGGRDTAWMRTFRVRGVHESVSMCLESGGTPLQGLLHNCWGVCVRAPLYSCWPQQVLIQAQGPTELLQQREASPSHSSSWPASAEGPPWARVLFSGTHILEGKTRVWRNPRNQRPLRNACPTLTSAELSILFESTGRCPCAWGRRKGVSPHNPKAQPCPVSQSKECEMRWHQRLAPGPSQDRKDEAGTGEPPPLGLPSACPPCAPSSPRSSH